MKITHYSQTDLILFHTPLSAPCRKIRIMLQEKELAFTLQETQPWQRPEELIQHNLACEVPVLLASQQQPICGAYSISEYLEEMYPEVQFFGNSPLERAEVRRITDWFDRKFEQEVSLNILFEKMYKRLYGYGEPSSDAMRAGRNNLRQHLDYLAYLLHERQWLAGEFLTLADITAAAHLSCLDYMGDVNWNHQPRVKEWYVLIKSRPSFRALLKDRIKGFEPPDYYDDLDF